MVRWVFRPYTQFPQAICTLALLRTSIRVSPDFFLSKYSSPSFGSHHKCYYSNLSSENPDRHMLRIFQWSHDLLSLRTLVCHQRTRIHDRLLGPCFKTGRRGWFCVWGAHPPLGWRRQTPQTPIIQLKPFTTVKDTSSTIPLSLCA